jgi:hypothetical protein
MDKKVAMIAGAAIGVGLMYFADPRMGRRRRALVGDQLVRARRTLNRSALITSRDLTNRARGLMAEMRACLRSGEVSDEVLEARVRAELGFLVSHPSAIEVTTEYGHVALSGPLLASEVKQVLKGVFSVRGVTSVDNQIERHKEPWNVPADGHGPAVRRLRQPARRSPTSLGGLGSLDQDESKSEPVWRSLISGASSGSLYHALAYAMAGHSTPTMTLGS